MSCYPFIHDNLVSEVKYWILLDFILCIMETKAKARQDKADAEAKTCQEQLKEDIKGHTEDLLEGQVLWIKG
jgi:hypothetical protein